MLIFKETNYSSQIHVVKMQCVQPVSWYRVVRCKEEFSIKSTQVKYSTSKLYVSKDLSKCTVTFHHRVRKPFKNIMNWS